VVPVSDDEEEEEPVPVKKKKTSNDTCSDKDGKDKKGIDTNPFIPKASSLQSAQKTHSSIEAKA
jgi:hypothetical protein